MASCETIAPYLVRDERGRYPAVDVFRGVAILTMLAANSAAGSLAAPHPFWIRIYGSFAAPIFIFLAGFVVAAGWGKHSVGHFVWRGVEILVVAALVDLVIWNVLPFTTFDVLYLIGLGIPVTALTLRLGVVWRGVICVGAFGMGPVLQRVCGYEAMVHEFSFECVRVSWAAWSILGVSGIGLLALLCLPVSAVMKRVLWWCSGAAVLVLAAVFFWESIALGVTAKIPATPNWWLRSWLVDGWFPVFPWIGFMLAGTLVFTHGGVVARNYRWFLLLGGVLLAGGLWFNHPLPEREGYSELFYPASGAYLCAAIGILTVGVSALRFLKPRFGLQMLGWLGSCSLFVYVLHSWVIASVLDRCWTNLPLLWFLVLYCGFAAVMAASARLVLWVRGSPVSKRMPRLVRVVVGS